MAEPLKLNYTRNDNSCNFCAVYRVRNQAICHRNPKNPNVRVMTDPFSSPTTIDTPIMSCQIPVEEGVEK